MNTCTDCTHWNPDLREQGYCENNTPAVEAWANTQQAGPVDCAHCPGFEAMPDPAPCAQMESQIKAAGGQWTDIGYLLVNRSTWLTVAIFPQISDNGCPAMIDAIANPDFFYRVRCGRLTLALGKDCLELAIALARAAALGQLNPAASSLEAPGQVSISADGFQGLLATFQAIANLSDDDTISQVCDNAIAKGLELLGQGGDQ